LHSRDRDPTPGDLLRERLEPPMVLFEGVAQRALEWRERKRHAIAGDLDLLRLRDHHVVEDRFRFLDFGQQRVLERRRRRARG